jgi:hypothetical protein
MPKKKLTKSLATRKFATMFKILYDLSLDKMGHPDSNVKMSMAKLLELQKTIKSAMFRTSK